MNREKNIPRKLESVFWIRLNMLFETKREHCIEDERLDVELIKTIRHFMCRYLYYCSIEVV